jgi:hypothetical protein
VKRNPHPARGSRVTALGVSATAFVSIVTSLAWNTHQAEAAANVPNPNAVPVGQITSAPGATSPVASPVTPAPATVAPTAPAAPTKTKATSKPASTPAPATVAPATPVAPSTPAAPAAPTTPKPVAVAPAAPAATVVYTCMSPGGKTENPTASGTCRNASYGYVLTKI